MYPRNAASPPRIAIGPVVQISDGAVQTSGCTVSVIPEGGAEGASGGSVSYSTGGIVCYVPTQAETNYTCFIVTAYKASCIPVSVTVVTTASATAGQVDVGMLGGAAQSLTDLKDFADTGYDPSTHKVAGVVLADTATNLTNAPTNGDLTATMKASVTAAVPTAAAIGTDAAGKVLATPAQKLVTDASGHVTLANGAHGGGSATIHAAVTGNITGNLSGSVGSVTGAVGSVTGNVGGNVTGSVGSVTGAVGSVTGSVGSVAGAVASVTGNVGGNVTGSVGSVVAGVTLANGAHGGGSATIQAAVTGNITGNLSGSVGSVTGAVGSVTGAVGSVTGAVGSVTAGVTVATNGDKSGYSLTVTPPTAAEIKTAMEADGSKIDHLWEMTEDDGGVRRLTENALEQAPSGTGGDATAENQTTILTAISTMRGTDDDTLKTLSEQLDALTPGSPTNITMTATVEQD